MLNLLGTNVVVPIIILLAGILIAVIIFFHLRKKFGAPKNLNQNISKIDVGLNSNFCSNQEMKFLEYLHRAMPKDFIAFPRVGVDQLVSPKKDRNAYNAIMSKYVDVVVFTRKNMTPVLVIDLIQKGSAQQQYEELDPNVIKVLKAVKLNLLKVEMEEAYDIEALKISVLNALPDKVVSALKENYIKENTKQ